MSEAVETGIAAAEATASAAFAAGLAALQAPVAAPPVAPTAAPPAEAAPATPAPLGTDPLALVTAPTEPVAAPPVEPAPAPATEAIPDFASADIVAAGARIGLSPEDIQRLYRATPQDQRDTLLARLGATTPAPAEPAPLDPAVLDRELQTYLTTQHPDGANLYQQYAAHAQRLAALAPELQTAENALRDAESLVRITASDSFDEMARADAATQRREASLKLQELRMEKAERELTRDRLDMQYRTLFSTTRANVLANHDRKLAEARAAAEQSSQQTAYINQFNTETETAVERAFASLGLDPAYKGSRPSPSDPPDLSFWSYCYDALTRATLRAPVADVGAFIQSLAPVYKEKITNANRIQAAAYGRLAQQRSSVPGPAPGVSAVASPEASPSFNGDLRALDELRATQFMNALRTMPS